MASFTATSFVRSLALTLNNELFYPVIICLTPPLAQQQKQETVGEKKNTERAEKSITIVVVVVVVVKSGAPHLEYFRADNNDEAK